MDSFWKTPEVESKVRTIPVNVKDGSQGHHFGWAYVTAYQPAIEFEKLFSTETKTLGYPQFLRPVRELRSYPADRTVCGDHRSPSPWSGRASIWRTSANCWSVS